MKLPNFLLRLRKNPNGETIRMKEDLKGPENEYFRRLGHYFRTAEIVLFVILFLFVTVFTLINAERVTYQNLYYFFKDFRTAVDNTDVTVEGIAYEVDGEAAYASFKGGLAVAGRERIQLLTASGGINTTDVLKFNDPALSGATDLLLVYARGEHTCHLYNSFTRIHTQSTEYAIRTAYLSESGAYSVTTGDADHESAVYVYDRNFEKINKYNINAYVTSAPLSENGKAIAILSYTVKDGVYETRLRLAETGTNTVHCDYTVEGEYPLGVAFTANDTALVLTSGGLHIVTVKNGGVALESFNNRTVGAFSLGISGASVYLSDKTDAGTEGGEIRSYTADGEMRYSFSSGAPVRSLVMHGEAVFYRTDAELCRVSLRTGARFAETCTTYGGVLVPLSEERLLLCESGVATYYRFLGN